MNGPQSINAKLRPAAVALLQIAWTLTPTAYWASGKRSAATQRKLYSDYVSGRSPYPAAAPGTSKHERGLAFDLGGLSSSQLRALGAIWTSWGGRWGGNFRAKDEIHFEV